MIAADRPFCSGKNRRHGMNLQVIASRMDTEPLLCRTRRPSTAFRVVEGSFGPLLLAVGLMNFVFPITALYLGPFALALYWRWGRADARTMAPMSTSRAALSRAAVASADDGIQMHGGQNAHHEMAGAAGPDGADASPADRSGPCGPSAGNWIPRACRAVG
jgi:hypothetical protein